MPKPVSKAQAHYFGLIASGKRKVKGFSAKEARNRLRGTNVRALPKRKRSK